MDMQVFDGTILTFIMIAGKNYGHYENDKTNLLPFVVEELF